jgi:predicted XRE-type DNA-binding protein
MKTRVVRSTGNVFADLGFDAEEAEHLRLRAALMVALRKVIEDRELTQSAAAKLFQVTQPRVSNLVRGRIDLFSIDTLVDMLGKAGLRVRIVVSPGRRRKIA